MDRLRIETPDALTTSPGRAAGRPSLAERRPDSDSLPPSWSHLGRRVLAEAWRRAREALALRSTPDPTPVVPAPRPERQA